MTENVRPEVVQQILDAAINLDPAGIPLHATAPEIHRAMSSLGDYYRSMSAHNDERARAWEILTLNHDVDLPLTWDVLWGELSEDQRQELYGILGATPEPIAARLLEWANGR